MSSNLSFPIIGEIAAGRRRASSFRSDMRIIIQDHDIKFFLLSHFPAADKAGLIENIIATNWPSELVAKYEKADMYRESKIVAGLKKTILPICSDVLLFARARDGVRSEVTGIFYDEGFANTIGISLYDAVGNHHILMLSGKRRVVAQSELATLLLSVMKALDTLTREDVQDEILSPRVRDCLRWSAAGKSSADIAQILNLSAHTVNDYLNTAMKRLNAVTRTQAVAIACRLRLI